MATPAKTAPAKGQAESPPPTAFPPAPQFAAAGGFSGFGRSDGVRLTRSNEPWFYAVSPSQLICDSGFIVPDLGKIKPTPGLNGNGKDRTGTGWANRMARDGFTQVPPTFPVTSFGEPYAGLPGLGTHLRVWHQYDDEGKTVHTFYTDAWTKKRTLGVMTVDDRDPEGWLKFRRDVLAWLCPQGLDAQQIEIATRPLLADIRDTARRNDEVGRQRLRILLGHMPVEHAPADVRERIKQQNARDEEAMTAS